MATASQYAVDRTETESLIRHQHLQRKGAMPLNSVTASGRWYCLVWMEDSSLPKTNRWHDELEWAGWPINRGLLYDAECFRSL